MGRSRKVFTGLFKAQVAIEAPRSGDFAGLANRLVCVPLYDIEVEKGSSPSGLPRFWGAGHRRRTLGLKRNTYLPK